MSPKQRWIVAGSFFMALGSVCNVYASEGDADSAVDKAAGLVQSLFAGDGGGAPAGATPVADTTPESDSGVSVTSFDTVSLNVQSTDLADVLQVLSVQGKRNIVPSPNVSGSVTANLYDVTFYEALDAILQQNGATYREQGNFIYIYTIDEYKKIEEAERTIEHKVMTLSYITAADASTFVTPLLSSAGSIAISGNVAPGFQPSTSDAGADSFAHPHTMVVRDYAENLAEIEKVVGQIDVKPMQVMVEATILKADVTDTTQFGVDWSILTDEALDAVTSPLDPITDMLSGAIDDTVGIQNNVPQGDDATFKIGISTNNVAAFISALDTVTDTTIVANPKLLVLNRQRADVLVGEKIGYLSTTATSTATTQTVEFLDTGTQLTVRPFITPDGYVRMELKPQISSARIRDVVPGTSTAAVTIPDEITQELTTNVNVQDGQTVILGGLFKEETTISRDQVPYLGDVPLVGAAFKGKDSSTIRSEVIFLITPHIVKDKSLYQAGQSTLDGVEMIRIGSREGLLPWSRSKLTASHLRDALRAIEAGDRDKALWEVDLALGLDPRQIEAIRLKEKLTGQRTYWPGRTMLDEAVDMMVEQATSERRFRARPMTPDPRPSEPVTDGEPLLGWNNQPVQIETEPAFVEPELEPQTTVVEQTAEVEPVAEEGEGFAVQVFNDVTVTETETPAETETTETETAEAETAEPVEVSETVTETEFEAEPETATEEAEVMETAEVEPIEVSEATTETETETETPAEFEEGAITIVEGDAIEMTFEEDGEQFEATEADVETAEVETETEFVEETEMTEVVAEETETADEFTEEVAEETTESFEGEITEGDAETVDVAETTDETTDEVADEATEETVETAEANGETEAETETTEAETETAETEEATDGETETAEVANEPLPQVLQDAIRAYYENEEGSVDTANTETEE